MRKLGNQKKSNGIEEFQSLTHSVEAFYSRSGTFFCSRTDELLLMADSFFLEQGVGSFHAVADCDGMVEETCLMFSIARSRWP